MVSVSTPWPQLETGIILNPSFFLALHNQSVNKESPINCIDIFKTLQSLSSSQSPLPFSWFKSHPLSRLLNLLTGLPASIFPPWQCIFSTCYWRYFCKARSYMIMFWAPIMLKIIKHFFLVYRKFVATHLRPLSHLASPLFPLLIPSPLDPSYIPAVSWHLERCQAFVCLIRLCSCCYPSPLSRLPTSQLSPPLVS